MKTIIACTDFSPNASHAVKYAASLAKSTKARLVLFHFFSYPVPATDLPMPFPSAIAGEMEIGLKHKLEELKAEIETSYSIEVTGVLRSWDFSLDLEEVFQEELADLVVMGMQGHSAILNALVGSVSATTIRRGNLPVLAIPRGVGFHHIKKIIFPCDDQEVKREETLQPLIDLATHFDSYIEVLTLFDLKKTPELVPQHQLSEAKKSLDILLAKTKHGYSYESETAVEKGIIYEAARSSADMVAMIPHHHSFWSNLLNQSRTQRVAASITLPLLVLGEKVKPMDGA